jgi:hypothetical protein
VLKDVLSTLIHDAEARGKFSGVSLCTAAPRITNLFFADDSVILLKACKEKAEELQQMLELNENCLSMLRNLLSCSVVILDKE